MSEVYCNQFVRDLTANYTAGSGSISVSAAAPTAVQTGTFRVRLANPQNTLLIVTNAGSGTTWNVTAEANDAACSAASRAVFAPEVTAGMLDGLHTLWQMWQVGSAGAIYYNGGNVGIGTTSPQVLLDLPNYSTSNSQQRIGSMEVQSIVLNNSDLMDNLYYNGSAWTYRNTGYGARIGINNGAFLFAVAPPGTIGAPASAAINAMYINNSGNVGIGTTSPTAPLHVVGLATYASDSAAGTGGLTTGAFYKDSTGGVHVKL